MRRKLLFIGAMVGLAVLLGATPTTATSHSRAIEVASGYKLVKVASAVGIMPTSMAFGHYGEIYVSSLGGFGGPTGQITVIPCYGKPYNLVKPGTLTSPMGLAVHPKTGHVYVSHMYYVDPKGDLTDPNNAKSRISIVNRKTGQLTTFVENLPSMIFGELPAPVCGSQGIDFDSAGNLYIAQGINDRSWAAGDPFNSAILKVDPWGKVSVFASGLRAPYDVRVGKENCYGHALYCYSGDNGEGAENEDHDSELDSRQYYDELNLVVPGKDYGWPEGGPAHPDNSHIGPLWNFDQVPANQYWPIPAWPVPTGIDSMPGYGGDVVFLCMYNCPSMFAADLGTIEMFSGINCTDRKVLAKYIDGPIDLRLSGWGHRLYFAEFATGDIYYIAPTGGKFWTPKPK
ncbi:MAG: PQQ-dependent sugar dehydrogenase [Planctomycetota bacterium]|jgi:hypothetical protein